MNSTNIADQLRGNYRPDRWMRQRKWWWAFFIWAIGVAGVNAYRIYEVIYDEEVKKKMPDLPPRWTHARFLEELVYDFVFRGRSTTKVCDTDSTSSQSQPPSIRSFSSFGQQLLHGKMYDLTCRLGRSEYLKDVPTKTALERNLFRHRLDGMRHNWIPANVADHCQYCYYKYMNEYDESVKCHYKGLKQNRSRVMHCLVYHVNLCPECDNAFHGADLSAYSSNSMP